MRLALYNFGESKKSAVSKLQCAIDVAENAGPSSIVRSWACLLSGLLLMEDMCSTVELELSRLIEMRETIKPCNYKMAGTQN